MASDQIKGILKISDPKTGEVFVHQENAIHFGNISWAIKPTPTPDKS